MFEWYLFAAAALAITLIKIVSSLTTSRKRSTTENKSVFISGCDSGIGNTFARKLDKIGFTVFAGCLMPNGDGAKNLQEETSDRLKIVPLNVTDDDSIKLAAEYVQKNLPSGEQGLYGLINNAGVLVYGEFDWQTKAQIESQVNINLLGTMKVTKHFLDLIIDTPGRIVNVTSINGKFAYPSLSIYCATKYGLEGFSDALRYEMKKRNVKVSIIEPGDFSKVTNILKPYTANLQAMLKELTGKKETRYKEEMLRALEKIQAKSTQAIDPEEAKKLFDIIVADVEDALLSEKPQIRYVSAPRGFRIMFSILTKLPGELMDKLLEKAIKRSARK